ncbi:MAG TPA: type II toxin-antitoxin system Phd/YefM family antitoxin [Gemmatimonadota bacterium]|nr:type II toxin-antitoxin system Phd/YefM family antitoxin [Gemmatimonadota bacterium]
MVDRYPIAEAKAKLAQLVRDAEEGRPVVITRHGKPVAAIVRAEDLTQLERLRAAGPEAGLVSLSGGWEGSDEFVEDVLEVRERARREAAERP